MEFLFFFFFIINFSNIKKEDKLNLIQKVNNDILRGNKLINF
jgi:hypothetical protein